ncbi:MAG: SH3 domain-containing protein, partial [Dehalococcoidia bacterium]
VTGLTDSEVFYNDPWEGTAGSMAADEFGKYWGRERTRYWALVFSAGTPADVAASPSPTAPPQKSVRDIDWNNREYLIVGSSVNEVVRVAGGEYSSTATCCASVVRAIVGPLLFGDVTDDGAEEAVVTMRWHHGGNFWESTVAVFSMRGSEPHQIATTALGADMDGDVRGVRLEGAWIVVTVSHGVDGDSHARGPTHVRDEFWRWNGSELIEDVARRNVVALASPSPASGDAQKVNAAAVGIIGGPLVPPPLTTDACRKANPPAGKGCVEQVGESETLRRGYAIVRAANPPDIGGGGTLILGRTASGAWGYYFSQQQAVKPGPLPTTGRICSSGGLNVRDRPSADGGIVTVLPDDSLQSLERFELAEGPTGQGWFGVRTSSGATGWVAGAYVYAESLPCSAAPLR